ncbi:MAG: hypothetical protein QXI19_02705 [Candidatus Caldarchaeum sp.]
MIDDMHVLIQFVLIKRLDGYTFDGVFQQDRVPDGTRWGVQVKKEEQGSWDVKTWLSKVYVRYPRADIENAVKKALSEFESFLQISDHDEEKLQSMIEKISDYYAQTIRLESLLRRMRAWYHRRMGS